MTKAQGSTLIYLAKCYIFATLMLGVIGVGSAYGFSGFAGGAAMIAGLLGIGALVLALVVSPKQFVPPPPSTTPE